MRLLAIGKGKRIAEVFEEMVNGYWEKQSDMFITPATKRKVGRFIRRWKP